MDIVVFSLYNPIPQKITIMENIIVWSKKKKNICKCYDVKAISRMHTIYNILKYLSV